MELTITDEAANLYINEIPLQQGDTLRLFVRVGGVGSGGFSVGVIKEAPLSKAFQIKKQGVTFFVNEDDFWYFDGMTIDYDEDLSYLQFTNPNFDEMDHP